MSNRGKALLLVFFAPFLAELVSGSTPPVLWILPPVFLVFAAIYGVSALVIRDFAIRIGGGPATIVLLGLAFGIVNEGMAAHSLFNPGWPGVGVLGSFGRWEGVNWLWAEWILPFHAVWSIAFPIFLTRQFWPEIRSTRFLTDRSLALLAPVPIVVAVADSAFFATYPLSLGAWLGMFVAVGVLIAIARRWGPRWSELRVGRTWVPRPWQAAAIGVLFFAVGQIGTWRSPTLTASAPVAFALFALAYLGMALFASTFAATPEGERARFAAVVGGIGFFVALSPIAEFGLGRIGLVPIDVVLLVLVIRLYVRRTHPSTEPTPSGLHPPPGGLGAA